MSRRLAAAMSTGKKNIAYRRKRDSANLAAIRAVARARPINTAGAQSIARTAIRSWARSNLEDKYWNTVSQADGTASSFWTTAPTIVSLSEIPNTTPPTDISRVGDKVTLTGMEFRALVYGGTADCHARVVLFQWKETNTSTSPSVTQVINSAASGADPAVNGAYNRDSLSSKSLRILADYRFPISSEVTNPNHARMLYFKTRKMAKQVQFKEGSGDGANKIYLYYVSTVGTGASDTNKPHMQWNAVLDFTDS